MARPAPHLGRIAIILLIAGVLVGVGADASELIFVDGFESGDALAWSTTVTSGPFPRVSLSTDSVFVFEHEGPVVIDVLLDRVPVTEVSVRVTTADGDAVAGADFVAVDEFVTFAPGETSRAVIVEITDDPTYERVESFSVSLSAPSGAILETPSLVSVTIHQSDWPPFVYFAEAGYYTAAYTAFEQIGKVVIPVRLSDASAITAKVDYATSDGTGLAGEDYGSVSGSLVFEPGQTERLIVIPILADGIAENGETFVITLSSPIDCALDFLLPDDAVVTIRDDAWVSFAQPEVSVLEGAATVTFSVTISARLAQEAQVSYSTTSGTATAGEDFTAVSNTLLFGPGVTTRHFSVPLIADSDQEGDETFSVSLSDPLGVPLGSPSSAVVTILDDELPEMSVSQATYSIGERGGEISVDLTLSFAADGEVSVDFTTGDGSATGGEDYLRVAGPLVIPAGQTSGTIPISILDDSIYEGDETFTLTLSNSQDAVLRTSDSAMVTIVDDDHVSILVSPSSLQTAEDGLSATFDIVLTSQPTAEVTIGLTSSDSTEGTVSPESVVFDPTSWSSPQPVTVTPVNDAVIDGHIQYLVEVQPATSSDLDYAGVDPSDVSVINYDDELRALITEPGDRVYGDGDILEMDASTSTVPANYYTWFAVLRDDGAEPMEIAHLANGLVDTFTTTAQDPAYRVRLVIAPPDAMPDDAVLRGAALPCTDPDPDISCASAELTIERADLNTFPFTTSYVFPDALLLVWGGSSALSMELERSSDGGSTWTAFPEPGNQNRDGAIETYTSYPDRTVKPGMTYHYRIKWNTYSEWFYIGNTFKAPGDPVVTPVWTASRPVPTFETVTWDCPENASRFLCLGTLTVHLDPEPGESLESATIRVFLNEETFEALGGDGDPIMTIWPDTFPFAGRDEPGCVTRKVTPDVEVTVPQGEDSITINIPNVVYGANSFRFEVEDGQGGFAERALLYGVHEAVGDFTAHHAPLIPLLFGTDVVSEQFELRGLGPVGIRSPDCMDGDWRVPSFYRKDEIYSAKVKWFSVSAGRYLETGVGTDEQGRWSANLSLSDGYDPSMVMISVISCNPTVAGHIGRSVLAEDGSPITVYETSQEVCALPLYNDYTSLHVDTTLDGPHPPIVDHVPGSLFSVADDEVLMLPLRFRITDLHHDVDVTALTITNESLDPVHTVYGFYSDQQIDHRLGHWGWFLAEVPMLIPAGQTSWDNQLRIQGSDAAGNILDYLVTVTRERPFVWAEIAEPDPPEAEPRQLVTFDGTASIVPGLGAGGSVARWIFLRYRYNSPDLEVHRDSGFLDGPGDLLIHTPMPDYSSMKARLIVAASMADFPADPSSEALPCQWNEGDGRCDAKEVVVDMADVRCYQKPDRMSVYVDSPSSPVNVGIQGTLHLQAHVSSMFGTVSHNWALFDSEDTQLEWPLGFLGSGDNGWSVDNADTFVVPGDHGVGFGDYFLIARARYPEAGCHDPQQTWRIGGSAKISLRVAHTIDGVAPGKVVEGGTFRVYSKTWAEGANGYVFVDDNPGDTVVPIVYYGAVQPGGYLEITPLPGELPAIGASWYVSVADDATGTGRSSNAELQIEPPGTTEAPNTVVDEESTDCGSGGVSVNAECAHKVVPGQIWQGEWGEAGDEDFFTSLAGAGTELGITLERVDTSSPPQDPNTPAPEIMVARPDGLVFVTSEPLPTDAPGASVVATATMDGRYFVIARTSKGSGGYQVKVDKLSEGGAGEPEFGFTKSTASITTSSDPTARFRDSVFDGFGNPISGVGVQWEEGSDCGDGTFCGGGQLTVTRSSVEGFASLAPTTQTGAIQLWRPEVGLPTAGGASKLATSTAGRGGRRPSPANDPVFGRIRTDGLAVIETDLPDLETAMAIREQSILQRSLKSSSLNKNGPNCNGAEPTCQANEAPVFRAAQLILNPGERLVDLEVKIFDAGVVIDELEGEEVVSSVPLTIEATACIQDAIGGVTCDVPVDGPIAVLVNDDYGAAIEQGSAICSSLSVTPGPFTYRVGRSATMNFTHIDENNDPCCWMPLEWINAVVVANTMVDDGQGGFIAISKRAEATVESSPRPAPPCEIRPYPPGPYPGGVPEIGSIGEHLLALGDTSAWQNIGSAYVIDACGNLEWSGANDDQLNVTGTSPSDPQIWTELEHSAGDMWWRMYLHSTYFHTVDGENLYYIPGGAYSVGLEVAGTPECSGGTVSYDHPVDFAVDRPTIQLVWEQEGTEPEIPVTSPGFSLRTPESGELIAWRVRPADSGSGWNGETTIYSNVQVKLYVAENRVVFDHDGNVVEMMMKVDDAKLCTGEVSVHHDPDAYPDPSWLTVSTTCDQVHVGEVQVAAYTEPVWWNDTFDGPIGISVGVVEAPSQNGTYYLVAEPLDEAFRRGESWRIDQDWASSETGKHIGTYRKDFDVIDSEPPPDLDCDRCEECAVGDIGLRNGNLRHSEAAPVPGLPAPFVSRTYDSLNREGGLVGAGWTSIFDATASVSTTTSGYPQPSKAAGATKSSTIQQVTVRTEDNRWFVFSSVDGGGYFQSWPEGGAPNHLELDGSDYGLELNGSPYRRTYRGSDGKLVKVTDIATGRDFTIVYKQTTGEPTEIVDSWRGSVASITVADGHITEINTAEGSVTFEYGGDATLDSTSASGSVWRSYAYSGDDLLTGVIDGAGYMIDTFTYADGRPTSSISAGDSITSVEWGATGPRTAIIGEQVVRTDAATGSSTYYYLRRVAGKYRVVEVMGECACSGNDRVYAYDPLGNLIMEQDGRGYITRHEYLGDGRRTLDEVGQRPSGCDPADYPEAPETCRVTVDELASFGAADLTPTDAYRAVWFAYDDANWPDKPTQVCRSSVLQFAGQNDRVSCRSTTYDPGTGQMTSSTETGWSGQSTATAALISRTTTRTFYGGAFPTAAFDPGGLFDPAWVTAAQPENLVRSSDGPRSDVADVVQYVYYPVVEVPEAPVPLPLRGRLAAQMDPLDNITRYEDYDEWGNARRIVGPTGIVTELTFDSFGRPLTSTVVGGEGCDPIDDPLCTTDLITTSTYEPGGGPLESVTSPGGVVTEYSYDSFGRILTTDRGPSVSELLERVENEYDPITGLRVRDSRLAYDAGSGWVEHSRTKYDHYITGQLIRVDRPRLEDDPSPSEEHYAYDVAGRMATLQDPNHTSANVEYLYDPLGRLERVRQLLDPAAPPGEKYAVTSYAYDAGGNMIAVTDANGNLTEYLVDDFGHTVRITSPVTGVTEMAYDAGGNLIRRIDGRGVTATSVFDASGRLTGITYDDGVTTEVLSFEYNAAGRRTRAESPDVVQTFTHSRRGLILAASQDIGGDVATTAYQYDLDGRLESVVFPSGRTVSYARDFAGRGTAITSTPPGGGTPVTVAENLAYLPFGPPTHLELGPPDGELVETRGYDWHYRRTAQDVADLTPMTLLDLDYDYDPAGNLTALTDHLGDRSAGYAYDDLGRLTGVTWADATRAFDYDPIGNLERIGVDEGLPGEGEVILGYTTNATGGNSPILESTDTYQGGSSLSSYTVVTDSAGNVTSDGLTGLNYDVRNKLDDRQLNGATLDYAYSADGRLVRSVLSDTGVITDLVRDAAGRRLAKYEDGVWRDYIYLGGQLLAYFDDGQTEPVQVIADHIGMPMMAVDGTGAVIWQAKTEPYGELRGEVGLSADPGLRYPGQWQDELDLEASCVGDTCTVAGPLEDSFSLFENGYRWYRPGWGRYGQADPLGLQPGGGGVEHLFLYARNSPPQFFDPLGLDVRVCCRPLQSRLLNRYDHCYLESDMNGRRTWGLHRQNGQGVFRLDEPSDFGGTCGPWTPDPDCLTDDCVQNAAQDYPLENYSEVSANIGIGKGRNSNTFARCVAVSCGVSLPDLEQQGIHAPGWGRSCPPGPTPTPTARSIGPNQ